MKITRNQLKELVKQSIYDTISEADSDKYTHIGYGKYKEKGSEKDSDAPTFKKTDSGKFVPFKGGEPSKKEKPQEEPPAKPKMTKISADPFAGTAGDFEKSADYDMWSDDEPKKSPKQIEKDMEKAVVDANAKLDARQNSINSVRQAQTTIHELLEYFKETPVSEALGTVKKGNARKFEKALGVMEAILEDTSGWLEENN